MDVYHGERVALVWLSPEILDSLLDGRRDEAERLLGARIPPEWPGPDAGFLRFRRRQMEERPEYVEWLVRAVVLDGEVVGHAGFHGPPGINERRDPDALEVGYSIFERHRGRGLATDALRALMGWAGERGITRFVASVSPENAPSLAIVRKLGFVEVGRHWDEEDGEELEFVSPP